MLERYGRNGGSCSSGGVSHTAKRDSTGYCYLHRRPPPASTGYCSPTVDLLQPPPATLHPASTAPPPATVELALSTGSYSTTPLQGVLLNHPSTGYCSSNPPPATIQPVPHRLQFNLPSTGSCSSSPPWGPVHPAPTGLFGQGPVHPEEAPRGHVHPLPLLAVHPPPPPRNTHYSSRDRIDRLQLAAVAKESLDRVQ